MGDINNSVLKILANRRKLVIVLVSIIFIVVLLLVGVLLLLRQNSTAISIQQPVSFPDESSQSTESLVSQPVQLSIAEDSNQEIADQPQQQPEADYVVPYTDSEVPVSSPKVLANCLEGEKLFTAYYFSFCYPGTAILSGYRTVGEHENYFLSIKLTDSSNPPEFILERDKTKYALDFQKSNLPASYANFSGLSIDSTSAFFQKLDAESATEITYPTIGNKTFGANTTIQSYYTLKSSVIHTMLSTINNPELEAERKVIILVPNAGSGDVYYFINHNQSPEVLRIMESFLLS